MSTSRLQNMMAIIRPIHLVFILTAVALITLKGFVFPANNNYFHIPIVLDYFSSTEGPSNAFTQSLQNYVSAFWIVVRSFTTEDNIYEVFFALYLLQILALVWVFLRFISDLTGKRDLSLASMACGASLLLMPFMQGVSILGRHEIMVNYLTHSQFVGIFVLLSFLFTLRGWYLTSAVILGIAFNVNAFVAVWSVLVNALIFFALESRNPDRMNLKQAFYIGGSFLLFAAPTLVWIVSTQLVGPPKETINFIQLMRQGYPYHNLVDVQPIEALHSVMLLAWMWAAIIILGPHVTARQQLALKAMGYGLTGVLAIGAALPYLTESRMLNNLYPLRMDAYVYWMLIICIAATLANNINSRQVATGAWIGIWSSLLNLNPILGIFFLRETWDKSTWRLDLLLLIACAIAVLVLAIAEGRTWLITRDYWGIRLEAGTVFWAVFAAIAIMQTLAISALASEKGNVLQYFSASAIAWAPLAYTVDSPMTPYALALMLILGVASVYFRKIGWLALALMIIVPILMIIFRGESKTVLLVPVAQISFWGGWLFLRRTQQLNPLQLARHVPMAVLIAAIFFGVASVAHKNGFKHTSKEETDFLEAQQWARKNTAPNTMFLPVNVDGFYLFSRRPVWTDAHHGTSAIWAPELYPTWAQRHAALTSVNSLASSIQLARLNNIMFVVLKRETFADKDQFPKSLVFENDSYRIYRAR